MKLRLQLIGALLLMVVAVSGRWHWRLDRLDPLCIGGRRLSDELLWLSGGAADASEKLWITHRVRLVGTNAIPLLLDYISTDEASSYYKVSDQVAKRGDFYKLNSYWRIRMAADGFAALGPLGQPAVPELMKLIERKGLRYEVVQALGATRDPRALTRFSQLITRPDDGERMLGLQGLQAMKEDARFLTERLIGISKQDRDDNVRACAVEAVGGVGDASVAVPYLVYMLQNDTNTNVRFNAAMALGNFPQQADMIRPVLQSLLQSQPVQVANGARFGLQELESALFVASLKGPANVVK